MNHFTNQARFPTHNINLDLDSRRRQMRINNSTDMKNLNPLKIPNENHNENYIEESKDEIKLLRSKTGKISSFIFGEDTNLLKGISWQSTKQVEFLSEQIKVNSFYQFFFSSMSILSAGIQYELETQNLTDENDEFAYYFAEWVCFVLSIGLHLTLFFEYLLDCEMDFLLKKLPKRIWLLSREKITAFVFQIIIFIFHPNPLFHKTTIQIYNLKFNYYQQITLNSIFFSLTLFRLWFVFKLLVDFSDFSSARAKRVCLMNNFAVNFFFCIKALMKKAPYAIYGTLLILSIIFCTLNLRIYERGLDSVSGQNFSNIWNCLWCVVITMTTVGFGDFFPSSIPGRCIGIIGSFMGVFLVSMLVITITNVLMLSTYEHNVFLIVEKLNLEHDYFESSQRLLAKYIMLVKNYKKEFKKPRPDKVKLKMKKIDYLKSYYDFQRKSNNIQSTFPPYSIYDAINENINFIEEEFNEMNKRQQKISDDVIKVVERLNINNNADKSKEEID